MSSFLFNPVTKVRSWFGNATSSQDAHPSTHRDTVDRRVRPFSMASSVTVVPRSPISPVHSQPSTLTTLQYQQGLISDFWSGSAAPRPQPPLPPPSELSHASHASSQTSELGSASSRKTKWGGVILEKDAKARREANAGSEPRTLSRLMFFFGFLFPLLWLVGAVFLFFPPKPKVELEILPINAVEERGRRIALYRKAEDKWAKRCLWAWVAFLVIVVVVVVGAVLSQKGA